MKFYHDGEALTEPRGFFVRVHCDVKGKRDESWIWDNLFKKTMFSGWCIYNQHARAALVRYCESLMKDQNAAYHAITAYSGNANACTGLQGEIDKPEENGDRSARHLKLHSKEGKNACLFHGKNRELSREQNHCWNF